MPLPTIVELTELPRELLVQIINPLDDESICALAKTCRTLHFVAFPPLSLALWSLYPASQLRVNNMPVQEGFKCSAGVSLHGKCQKNPVSHH